MTHPTIAASPAHAPELMLQAAPLGTLDEEARTCEVTFTTGDLVSHWVLHRGEVRRMPTRIEVTEEAIDLDCLKASGPVLDSHMAWGSTSVIGAVEDAWIQDGTGRARLRFADTDDVAPIWAKIQQGVLRNVSAGFKVLAQEVRVETNADGEEFEVMVFTQIRVEEISMVAIGADKGSRIQSGAAHLVSIGGRFDLNTGHRAGQDASLADAAKGTVQEQAAAAANEATAGDMSMADRNQSAATPAPTQATPGTPTPPPAVDAETVRQQAVAEERARMSGIDDIAAKLQCAPELVTQAKADGITVDEFRAQAVDAHAAKAQAATAGVGGPRASASVQVDAREKFVQGAEQGQMARMGLGGERNEFTGLTLAELARQSLVVRNERVPNGRMEMVGAAFVQSGAHTTSDFANILSNIMGKAALKGWEEAEETYQIWTSKGILTDFKPTKRVGVGLAPSLLEVAEGAEYKYGTIGDRGETVTLATYGRLLKITRQAIINDDLSLLSSLPMKMGRAAKRTIGDLAYAVLTANAAMADGTALFHADHANLAGSGAALSVTTLSNGRTAMKTQVEAAGGPALNIRPAYLIVPAALETAADELMVNVVHPGDSKGHARNPVNGMAEVVADARLDTASVTAWYLAANPNAFDTVEISYLDGVETPYIEQKTGWSTDGAEVKVRIDAAAAALDHRGLYKNAGA